MRLYLVLDVVVNMLINVLTVSLNLFLNDFLLHRKFASVTRYKPIAVQY